MSGRSFRSPGGECHDLFGAEFIGSPCHHRVLKPPGGGTSDIFGGSEPAVAQKPAVRKKSVQSSSIVLDDNVNSNGTVTPPIENGHGHGHIKQGTCNERLFGPPLETNGPNPVAKTSGEILLNGKDHTDAPLKKNNEPMTNGKASAAEVKNAAPVGRQRIPPGGYSSGLW